MQSELMTLCEAAAFLATCGLSVSSILVARGLDRRSRATVRCWAPGLPLPRRQTKGAGAFDLSAAIDQPQAIPVGGRLLVPSGAVFDIPDGIVGLICPRSGLALQQGVTVHNGPGVIDSDYKGETKVLLHNAGERVFVVEPGMRIAQIAFLQLPSVEIVRANSLGELSPPSARGMAGFGSTGAS